MKLRKYLPKFYIKSIENSYKRWVGKKRGRVSDKNFELVFICRFIRLVIICLFLYILSQGGLENHNDMKVLLVCIGLILIALIRFLCVM